MNGNKKIGCRLAAVRALVCLLWWHDQAMASKVNVEVMHMPVHQVFVRLATAGQINLVMQGDMQAPVHVLWQQLPAREALRMLCQTIDVNCYWWGEGGLSLDTVPAQSVALPSKQTDRQSTNYTPDQTVDELVAWQHASGLLVTSKVVKAAPADLQLLTIPLQFAQAEDVALQLRGQESLLAGGQLLVDKRSQSLLLHVPRAQVLPLSAIVRGLDQPLQQLHIEARIVIATSDVGASLRQGLQASLSSAASGISRSELALLGNNGLAALQMGVVASHILLNLELAAMEASGQVMTLAQPQIVVQEGQLGVVETGQEVPYVLEQDGKQSRQWKQAVLGLTVTPRVLPDNKVELDLSVVQDSVGELLENGELALNTHRLHTRVSLGLGQTLVLGGALYEQQLERLLSNPAWMTLPFFGPWMQERKQQSQRFELLVFVTPRLVNR